MHRLTPLAVLLAVGIGCSSGQNTDCRWPEEPPRVLDLRLDGDAAHLVGDVELAEELSVRFADALEVGPGPVKQRLRLERCFEPLVAGIAARHGVSSGDVRAAQARIGHRGLNLVVNLPVGGFFVLATMFVLRGIRRRFPDETGAALVASAIAAVAVAGMTTGFGRLWQMLYEAVRLGNGHLGGTRGLRLPWVKYSFEYFLVILAAFVVIALVFHSRARRSTIAS